MDRQIYYKGQWIEIDNEFMHKGWTLDSVICQVQIHWIDEHMKYRRILINGYTDILQREWTDIDNESMHKGWTLDNVICQV